jgi:hypothetical protein
VPCRQVFLLKCPATRLQTPPVDAATEPPLNSSQLAEALGPGAQLPTAAAATGGQEAPWQTALATVASVAARERARQAAADGRVAAAAVKPRYEFYGMRGLALRRGAWGAGKAWGHAGPSVGRAIVETGWRM